jgi:mannose-6-phosphate isomerase-like protein (cupin superfamily)
MASPYSHKRLSDVVDRAPDAGIGEIQEARFARGDLEAEQTGLSHHRLKPNRRQAFAHRHNKAEEIYVVLGGSGRMKLDEDILELQPLDAVRVAPGVTRQFEAREGGLEFLALGPHHERDGEMIKDWWKD